MGLFDILKNKRKENIFKTEPDDTNAETRKNSNISNPTIAEKNDSQFLENMFTVENRWLHRKQEIINCLENNMYIEFDFLKEAVKIEPDGYGGTDRCFYFEDGNFYTRLSHWDGGNMFANRSHTPTRITKAYFARQLDKKKIEILRNLSQEDKIKFEPIYSDIETLLLKNYKNGKVDKLS